MWRLKTVASSYYKGQAHAAAPAYQVLRTQGLRLGMIRGIRGATTVEQDTTEAIEQAVVAMLTQIITLNAVAAEQIVTAFFTITPDITAISPARVARTHFPWQEVPMMCSVEPYVQGLPPRCIRILIQFESPLAPSQIHHVYLNDAVSLRPDRVEGS